MPAGAPGCSGSVTSAAAVACVGFSASGAHSGGARSRWFLWLLVGPVVAPELAGTTLGCRGMVGSMFTSRLWHWCGCGWSPTALHRQTILPHPAAAAGAAGGGCCGGMRSGACAWRGVRCWLWRWGNRCWWWTVLCGCCDTHGSWWISSSSGGGGVRACVWLVRCTRSQAQRTALNSHVLWWWRCTT